ncbi:hypothetical protein C7999DRAFT_40687 [Corynascus novoguineensis]|uniref:Uncharacterized protein n=1 Tax=Corynascus novoguineensis TaxID=1126955 RepID=A0AAN7CTH3_9PEZI|nr:hypothetical protein C7999DRAFT_40687 [Corynascus novoguineensis]
MDIFPYAVTYTILAGLFIVPLTILWLVSFCYARRKNDPARVGLVWLKVVYPIWILSLLLHVAEGGLISFFYSGYDISFSPRSLSLTATYLAGAAEFFGNLASIFLYITLVELASGFLFCLKTPGEPSSSRRLGRFAILGWSFVLFALAISRLGLYEALYSRHNIEEYEVYLNSLANLNRLGTALIVLLWLTSLPVMGYAAFVVHKTRQHPLLRSAAVLLLVCIILEFIRYIVRMAIFVSPSTDYGETGYITSYIVAPFFDFVFTSVILVMLYALGIRKHKGLWSQPKPEWSYPAVMFYPTAYPPGQQLPQPQFMQPQQQPMQQQPTQNLPAYLQYAQQQAAQQQQQQPPPQGYYYQPQQTEQQPQEHQPNELQSQQQPRELQPKTPQPQQVQPDQQ